MSKTRAFCTVIPCNAHTTEARAHNPACKYATQNSRADNIDQENLFTTDQIVFMNEMTDGLAELAGFKYSLKEMEILANDTWSRSLERALLIKDECDFVGEAPRLTRALPCFKTRWKGR